MITQELPAPENLHILPMKPVVSLINKKMKASIETVIGAHAARSGCWAFGDLFENMCARDLRGRIESLESIEEVSIVRSLIEMIFTEHATSPEQLRRMRGSESHQLVAAAMQTKIREFTPECIG